MQSQRARSKVNIGRKRRICLLSPYRHLSKFRSLQKKYLPNTATGTALCRCPKQGDVGNQGAADYTNTLSDSLGMVLLYHGLGGGDFIVGILHHIFDYQFLHGGNQCCHQIVVGCAISCFRQHKHI